MSVSSRWTGEELAGVEEPEVGDVLVSGQDGTAGVQGHLVADPPHVQVLPVQGRPGPGRHRETQQREDGGSPGLDVVEIEEEGRHPVLVDHGLVVLVGIEVVHVRLVMSSNAVRDDLQSLCILRVEASG